MKLTIETPLSTPTPHEAAPEIRIYGIPATHVEGLASLLHGRYVTTGQTESGRLVAGHFEGVRQAPSGARLVVRDADTYRSVPLILTALLGGPHAYDFHLTEDQHLATLAHAAGVEYARAAVTSGTILAPDGAEQILGCEWDGCPSDFPDIYDVFAETVGRDYDQSKEADELLVLVTANAWEAGYASVAA